MKDKEPLKVYEISGVLDMDRLIKQMREDGVSDDLILHTIENQLLPQILAAEIGDKENFSTGMVNTNLDSPGHLITCSKCGMQAKSPKEPPPDMTIICPRCLKDL